MGKYKDLTGRRFGRLMVVRDTGERLEGGHIVWECKCRCGEMAFVTSCNLRSGNTRSCGCLRTERVRKAKEERKKKREKPH